MDGQEFLGQEGLTRESGGPYLTRRVGKLEESKMNRRKEQDGEHFKRKEGGESGEMKSNAV